MPNNTAHSSFLNISTQLLLIFNCISRWQAIHLPRQQIQALPALTTKRRCNHRKLPTTLQKQRLQQKANRIVSFALARPHLCAKRACPWPTQPIQKAERGSTWFLRQPRTVPSPRPWTKRRSKHCTGR